MNDDIEHRLWQLRVNIEAALDRIQATATANFRTLARSTGQNMRVDRVRINRGSRSV